MDKATTQQGKADTERSFVVSVALYGAVQHQATRAPSALKTFGDFIRASRYCDKKIMGSARIRQVNGKSRLVILVQEDACRVRLDEFFST